MAEEGQEAAWGNRGCRDADRGPRGLEDGGGSEAAIPYDRRTGPQGPA